jgi:hypothetical protein
MALVNARIGGDCDVRQARNGISRLTQPAVAKLVVKASNLTPTLPRNEEDVSARA